LATNIFVNSQSKFPDLKTLVGLGGAFTYGIAVRTGTDGNRYVIDEDGTELSFGVARDPWLQFLSTLLPPWLRPYVPQSVPEPGVYSRLLFIGSGWVLADAGPPGSLHAAGNYQYFFDTQGALQYLVDPSNNLQYVAYSNGVPVAIVDLGTKRMVRFEYESNQPGLIARIIENGGAAVSHLTYQSGRLIGIILRDANGVKVNEVAFGYDSVGRLSTLTADNDPASRISWSYTQAGTGTSRATMNWGSGATAGSSGLDYVDDSGSFTPGVNRTSRSNLQGGRTLIDFDAAGNLVREERPKLEGAQAPPVTVYGYDANRNVTSISDGLTALTISYNSLGKVTKTVDALGFERSFTYQGVDLLTASDSTGPLLTLKYEDPVNPHSPTSLTNGGGHTWRLTYNHFGQVLTVTPPAGSPIGVTRYTYDEDQNSSTLGYLKQIIDGAGDITRFDAYSPLGDLTVVTTSPREGVTNTTRFEYDVAQRVTKVVHPDGKSANKEYTGRFLTRAIDEAGTATGFSYCATCGALEKVQAPLAKTLTANHNGDHDVSKFIDARNKTTDYGYGLARELKQIRYPDGSVTNYQYDDTGRLSVVRDGRNISTTISYDKAGRVEKYTFSNGQTPIEFTYLLDGRISTMKDEAGTTTYRYTADRLLESVVYDYTGLSAPQTVRYAYNPDQTLRSMDWLSGSTTVATWSYSYDEAGRLTRVTNGFGDSTTYAYDHEGKVVSQKNSNGTEATYAFNEQRGWPTSIQWKSGAATFASYGLTYDQGSNTVGNLTKVQESGGSEATYGYDALYRLTSEARTGGVANTFGYDLSGNVTTKNGAAFAAYDDANKISAATHDGNGNILTSPILGADALTWDARNKLRSMGATSYKYDGGGHRVVRAEGGQTTLYIFSGDTLIGEVANGAPSAVYTWGADGLAAERLIGAQRSLFYHFGPQGETRQLTDGAGAVVATYTYDAYGQELQSTGTDTNPFRYGGKVGYYADRSNYLATARWYSPRLMRWLSRDPIGYRGGDNQYTYVSDRPIQSLDPSGLLKVYIWHPNLWTGSVGHASIQLDGAGPEGYISFWPSGNPFYSPHVSARTYKDDIEADGTPSRVITLSNLDETQILRWWRELQNSGNFYNLETRNCSNVAADALLIGLGLRPSPFIWTPRMVEEFAEEISTGIYDQKEWPLP
jgi:RHS repeat-associated protein